MRQEMAKATGKGKEKKKEKKNYLDENGKIDMSLRIGKPLTDAYSYRSKMLVKKCEELVKTTGSTVKFFCRPPWDNGIPRSFDSRPRRSPRANKIHTTPERSVRKRHLQEVSFSKTPKRRIVGSADRNGSNNTNTPVNSKSIPKGIIKVGVGKGKGGRKRLGTTSRKRIIKSKKSNPDKCAICGIVPHTPENEAKGSHWVHCSAECGFWVHCVCVHIYYPSTENGRKALDSWAKKHFFCPRHMTK